MTAYTKIGGDWKEFDPNVKVNGSWSPVDNGYVKVNGEWKEFYSAIPNGVPAGFTYFPSVGKAYRYVSTSTTQATANTNAINAGGWLAVPENATENSIVLSMLTGAPANTKVWIGVWDLPSETNMWYITGHPKAGIPISYANFESGQPDNAGNQDAFAINSTTGKWFDELRSISSTSIQEWYP